MRILLVDDDAMALKTIGNALVERGHDVTTASDGLEALRRMSEGVPDLVVCDIQMPGMDGLAFLREARERFPEVPVILTTGDRDVDTAVAGFRGGATDYVKKPINLQELLACIESIDDEGPAKRRR